MNISFLWWNTSLSPVGKDRASKEQKIKAHEMVDIFICFYLLQILLFTFFNGSRNLECVWCYQAQINNNTTFKLRSNITLASRKA